MGIRRAQCFRCQTIFDIQDAVARLLAPEPPEAEGFEGIEAGDLDLAVPAPAPEPVAFEPEPEPEPEPALDLEPEPLPALPALPPVGATVAMAIPPLPPPPDFSLDLAPAPEPEPAPYEPPPSLTLGDLEGVDAEILDKTVVDLQVPPPAEEPRPQATYASARDAIEKLLGAPGTPLPPPSNPPPATGLVEDTLQAMDATLRMPARMPEPPPPVELPQATASTVKISSKDLMAALAQMPPPPPGAQDPNLLKVQIGDETFNNLSTETVNEWIRTGRLQDHHLVARQFSDHWIEAGKVPTLRPAFEELRRAQVPDLPPPPPEPPAPPKRSLFGGLFGRG